MILVGENLNIMSQKMRQSFKNREPEPVQTLAKAEDVSGMDYLDLSVGHGRQFGAELMIWLINAVQEISHKPLSLDTTNSSAIEAGLKVCTGNALVNSISLQSENLSHRLEIINQHNAEVVGLLWGEKGMPRDSNERCSVAVDLVYKLNQQGIPNRRIWLDPIVTPVSGDTHQLQAVLEFLKMAADIVPGCKSIIGLSNVSNGSPSLTRPYLNRTYLIMLMRYGLHAAIINALDNTLVEIARNRKMELIQLVHNFMDNPGLPINSMSFEDKKYAKTVRVLTGSSLYSHSWLEI